MFTVNDEGNFGSNIYNCILMCISFYQSFYHNKCLNNLTSLRIVFIWSQLWLSGLERSPASGRLGVRMPAATVVQTCNDTFTAKSSALGAIVTGPRR